MLKTKTKNQKFKATGMVCATALALCLYAPRVEAFGGLGILGHKSSHKGGVNAIGVHIDANNTQQPNIEIVDSDDSAEPTCPPEKQCGDYCCQGDNVCNKETGQCCNDFTCCEPNASAYCVSSITDCGGPGPQCCAGTLYCSHYNQDGSCRSYSCCKGEDKTVSCIEYYSGSTVCAENRCYDHNNYRPYCQLKTDIPAGRTCSYWDLCPKTKNIYEGLGWYDADVCCTEEDLSCAQYDANNKCIRAKCCGAQDQAICIAYDEFGKCVDAGCCPADSTGFASWDGCCEAGTEPTEGLDGETHCCPEGSSGWTEEDGCI